MGVPVLMYHSISDNPRWLWGHLSCPVQVFEEHVRALVSNGFTTISLQDLYDHLKHGTALPPNPVVLTFDDGYLDNWVYAFPILKRYGCKGTIFISPEFVDPTNLLRPNLDDVAAGKCPASSLHPIGFLSWGELSAMEATGVMDIQSHTLTHTWHFCDEQIVDYHHPGDAYPWLAWNAKPERKHLWLNEDQSVYIPFGMPVYTHERSLVVRQYSPDPRLADFLVQHVHEQDQAAFFQHPNWQDQLRRWTTEYCAQHPLEGRWETDEQYSARVHHELIASKEIIETRLRKKVNFVCWPGGRYNDLTEHQAMKQNYLAMVYAPGGPAQPALDVCHVPRIGAPTLGYGKTRTLYRNGRYLVYALCAKQGMGFYHLGCKVLTVYDVLRLRVETAIEPIKLRVH